MAALDDPAYSLILHPSFLDVSELVQQDGRKKSVNLCNKLSGLLLASFVVIFTQQYCFLF